MKEMDAYIGLRGSLNISEMSDVESEKMAIYQSELLQKVHFKERVANTKWVVLRWPTSQWHNKPICLPRLLENSILMYVA